MYLQLAGQLAAGFLIVNAEATVHLRVLLLIKQVKGQNIDAGRASQAIIFLASLQVDIVTCPVNRGNLRP